MLVAQGPTGHPWCWNFLSRPRERRTGVVIENSFLIISEEDSSWLSVVAVALAPFGRLQVASLEKALDLIRQQPWRMIIVDAADVDHPSALVARIRAICPEARVVVATASPTWRQTREAFRAGATDYIRKSLSKVGLQEVLAEALNKTPPP
jgi:DNA-binding NtrC family response regulator